MADTTAAGVPMAKDSNTLPDFLGIVRHANKYRIIDARDLWKEAMEAAKAGYLDADGARCLFTLNDKGRKLLEDNEPVVEPVSPNPPVVSSMESVSSLETKDGYTLHPFGSPLTYVVVCLDGPGNYALAKRRVFKARDEAQEVADSIPDTRDPLVVEGRWHQLFLPQDLPE